MSAMLSLMAAGSSPPTAIQAAAHVFRDLFSGNGNASMTAARTLQTVRSVPNGGVPVTDIEAEPTKDTFPCRSPVAILGAALQDWLDEGSTLRVSNGAWEMERSAWVFVRQGKGIGARPFRETPT